MQGNFCFPLYDLSIGLGEDIIGALNYYGVGDPLNLLAIFINSQNCAYIFTFMFFLRLWLAVKPQIISGDFRRLYKVEIPVTVCG